jgi:hypothetical protein
MPVLDARGISLAKHADSVRDRNADGSMRQPSHDVLQYMLFRPTRADCTPIHPMAPHGRGNYVCSVHLGTEIVALQSTGQFLLLVSLAKEAIGFGRDSRADARRDQ